MLFMNYVSKKGSRRFLFLWRKMVNKTICALVGFLLGLNVLVYALDLSGDWEPWGDDNKETAGGEAGYFFPVRLPPKAKITSIGRRMPPLSFKKNYHSDVAKRGFISSLALCRPAALFSICLWQVALSPQQGETCPFSPTCSHYSYKAIKKYGFLQGLLMASERLQRCHYCAGGGYYQVGRRLYDPPENHVLWGKETGKEIKYGYYENPESIFPSLD